MTVKKTKLELTWIGKDQRPKLEPRILLEDPSLSYHAKQRVTDQDKFDNRLIFGDNLLALKALEHEFAGKVKCVYIDPPYNTGSAFEHYDDGLEHSIWLGLMRERFEFLRRLLTPDGALFVHLDDHESAYCKVLLDEVFGRAQYVNTIIFETNKAFGFKGTSQGLFKQANHVFFYAKDKNQLSLNEQAMIVEKGYDKAYGMIFTIREGAEATWAWEPIQTVVAKHLGFEDSRAARKELGSIEFEERIAEYAISNAKDVFQLASVTGGALAKRRSTITKSKARPKEIVRHPNDDMDYMFIGGRRVLPYIERFDLIDGRMVPVERITDIWDDIALEGLAKEGGVDFPRGKKPEGLVARIIALTTKPGDIVLDSFGGSGTTGAVAHKMGRRWIMVELGEHCHTHIIPRLQKVVDGTDQSGISKAVGWQGGGGFRYFKLAPSLLETDKWGNLVINKTYNPHMLAEALCKLEGFTYAPSTTHFWMQGHSTERDFLYVTTQHLTSEQLQRLSDEVGEERSLLVLCTAFKGKAERWPNLTVKKIPMAVLKQCEWGHDDYSLNVENLPMAQKPKKTKAQATLEFENDPEA